jgi:hypothetical protein
MVRYYNRPAWGSRRSIPPAATAVPWRAGDLYRAAIRVLAAGFLSQARPSRPGARFAVILPNFARARATCLSLPPCETLVLRQSVGASGNELAAFRFPSRWNSGCFNFSRVFSFRSSREITRI